MLDYLRAMVELSCRTYTTEFLTVKYFLPSGGTFLGLVSHKSMILFHYGVTWGSLWGDKGVIMG